MREIWYFLTMLFAAVCGCAVVVWRVMHDPDAARHVVQYGGMMVVGAGVVWCALLGAGALAARAWTRALAWWASRRVG